jgi:hypothetical protein
VIGVFGWELLALMQQLDSPAGTKCDGHTVVSRLQQLLAASEVAVLDGVVSREDDDGTDIVVRPSCPSAEEEEVAAMEREVLAL